jgi:hypothetical protein
MDLTAGRDVISYPSKDNGHWGTPVMGQWSVAKKSLALSVDRQRNDGRRRNRYRNRVLIFIPSFSGLPGESRRPPPPAQANCSAAHLQNRGTESLLAVPDDQ